MTDLFIQFGTVAAELMIDTGYATSQLSRIDIPIIQNSKLKIQNYPNPTDGIVNCQVSIVDVQRISLKIYDLQGREVGVLLDEKLPAGEHIVCFDLSELPKGIYILRMTGIPASAGTGSEPRTAHLNGAAGQANCKLVVQ